MPDASNLAPTPPASTPSASTTPASTAPAVAASAPAAPSAIAGLDLVRLAAFAAEPGGGNPAGVVFDAEGLSEERLQAIAREVDYPETAFIVQSSVGGDDRHVRLRYFSPESEVPFCGHATIATAVELATRRGAGDFTVETNAGTIAISTSRTPDERMFASFRSVEPATRDLPAATTAGLLDLLGLTPADLDDSLPPREAFAGNWHPIVPLRDRHVFDTFAFDPAAARALMTEHHWHGTITVVHVPAPQPAGTGTAAPLEVHARNLFPVGTITEDPATGSAAAALGAYLRATGTLPLPLPARFTVHQGSHVGRPSLLTVEVPETGGITVEGTATPME
ncbi:PhzF family phenazine biosynthesis protein [Herbiconiux liukaitaii]|uniref:PhzF family phenazine biosynthesis protein n=1 Tax=Herbiconiux liukaitaii TaxID=3342799 RepID=UPI0035B7D0EC